VAEEGILKLYIDYAAAADELAHPPESTRASGWLLMAPLRGFFKIK